MAFTPDVTFIVLPIFHAKDPFKAFYFIIRYTNAQSFILSIQGRTQDFIKGGYGSAVIRIHGSGSYVGLASWAWFRSSVLKR